MGHGRRSRSSADLPGPTRPPAVNLGRPCLIRALYNAQYQRADADRRPPCPPSLGIRASGRTGWKESQRRRTPAYHGITQPPAQNASAPHAACARCNAANDAPASNDKTASSGSLSVDIIARSDRHRELRASRVQNPRFLAFQWGPVLAFALCAFAVIAARDRSTCGSYGSPSVVTRDRMRPVRSPIWHL